MANWQQSDVFPIIAHSIDARYNSKQDFVTHDEIVEALLADPEAVRIIEEAHQAQPERTREWLAHNMVAWFSERITVGQSEWSDRLIRQKIDGKWAYRPCD